MSSAIPFILAVSLSILITVIAFPRHNTAQICLCMALMGIMLVGFGDAEERGGNTVFAKIFDPFSEGLVRLIGLGGSLGVGSESHYYSASEINSSCPDDPHSGNYGPTVTYDDTIRIIGSPQFVSRVVVALHRLHETPSYRYAKALRIIEEANLPRDRWAQVSGRHTLVSPRAAARSCTFLAGTIAHEGAHVIHGAGHGPVYAAQAKALEEMGELRAARSALAMASRY